MSRAGRAAALLAVALLALAAAFRQPAVKSIAASGPPPESRPMVADFPGHNLW